MHQRIPARLVVLILAFVCVVVVIVGCVSPWANAFIREGGVTRAFSGTDANAGQTTMIGAILAGLMLVVATWREWRSLSLAAAIPAGFAATIAAYRLADIENFVEGAPNATAAWGVWAATIAAVALFVLCLVHALLPPRLRLEPTPQPPAPSVP